MWFEGDPIKESSGQNRQHYWQICEHMAVVFESAVSNSFGPTRCHFCESQYRPVSQIQAISVCPPIVSLAAGDCVAVNRNSSCTQATNPETSDAT